MATPTAVMAYSEQLRKALKAQFLADSDDSEHEEEGEAPPLGVVSTEGTASLGLRDLEAELETFREHDVIKGILDKGCDLQSYAKEVEEKLRRVELDSIQDYIQESDNLSSLHHQVIHHHLSHHFTRLSNQIHDCDRILVTMEQMLGKFQSDLGQVSEEIRQLQSQSQTMSVKLRNRRAAEEALGNFIDHIAVPDDMINSVLESEVDHNPDRRNAIDGVLRSGE